MLAEIEARTGRKLRVLSGNNIDLMETPPIGSGHYREYTRHEIERLVAWERMEVIGGVAAGVAISHLRLMALDSIPRRCEGGALVLSAGEAHFGWPEAADVERGMMAVWVHDDCYCAPGGF